MSSSSSYLLLPLSSGARLVSRCTAALHLANAAAGAARAPSPCVASCYPSTFSSPSPRPLAFVAVTSSSNRMLGDPVVGEDYDDLMLLPLLRREPDTCVQCRAARCRPDLLWPLCTPSRAASHDRELTRCRERRDAAPNAHVDDRSNRAAPTRPGRWGRRSAAARDCRGGGGARQRPGTVGAVLSGGQQQLGRGGTRRRPRTAGAALDDRDGARRRPGIAGAATPGAAQDMQQEQTAGSARGSGPREMASGSCCLFLPSNGEEIENKIAS